jgi:hypothetical protein
MEYVLLKRDTEGYYECFLFSNNDICSLGCFFSSEDSCSSNWNEWIENDLEKVASGNHIYLEKKGSDIYIGDLYDARDEITTLKISKHTLLKLLQKWHQTVCKIKPKNVIIFHDNENDTFTIEMSNKEYVVLKRDKKGLYEDYYSNDHIRLLGSFFASEVTYTSSWDQWIIDDTLGLEINDNCVYLKKRPSLHHYWLSKRYSR